MNANQTRTILITSALPYANGAIHLGHLVEYIQTDIWKRFQKLQGHQCLYFCADDTHGTPVMLRAEQEGVSPEELIERVHLEHLADFKDFLIDFDHYHSTNSAENYQLSRGMYQKLHAAGLIEARTIEQLYDPVKNMFLPDRYIKGECPKCHAQEQYGDACESCGTTYSPTELINPVSAVSGSKPEVRQTEHFFFKLSSCEKFLQEWFKTGGKSPAHSPLQPQAQNKMQEWLDAGLRDWDITRDAPYFGFEIPDAPGKYLYVWLDAPIGYMASSLHYFNQHNLDFEHYWGKDSEVALYHFIGKDILQFHALFWPATLQFAGYRTPNEIFVHGFLTVNGQKMSKSRGTFITARTYLKHLNAEALRYYFAAKLNDRIEDIDLNLDDFLLRVNSNLVGKYVNIASRCANFISKKFAGQLSTQLDAEGQQLCTNIAAQATTIGASYAARRYSEAIRLIMALADDANEYIDRHKPWEIAKQPDATQQLHQVCSTALNVFRILTVYLKPVIPALAEKVEQFLNIEPLQWQDSQHLLLNHKVNAYKHLAKRIEQKQIDAIIKDSQQDLSVKKTNTPSTTENNESKESLLPSISYEDFAKIDLRIVRIAKAEAVEGADKLLRLTLDLGDATKQVFAGIKTAYQPEQLEGKLTVMVANLAPRKMRFGVSEGMVLAAGPGGKDLWILHPDTGAKPGMKVK